MVSVLIFPLAQKITIPTKPAPGSFGAVRKYDIHTGVDLYCADNEKTPVYAMENGKVLWKGAFTGPKAGSPWWNDTEAVAVIGESGRVILYGEIEENSLFVGQQVTQGDTLSLVSKVLKKDKGSPTKMLHMELYDSSFIEPVWWRLGEEKPDCLLDPTDLLKTAHSK